MDNNKNQQNICKALDDELETLCAGVLTLGRLVEKQIQFAVDAFIEGDFNLARKCIKLTSQVETLKESLDHDCLDLLASRQPVGFDLRFLVTVIKVIHELELMGSLAESIAKMAIRLDYGQGVEAQKLSAAVISLLNLALDTFAHISIQNTAAINVITRDLNQNYSDLSRQLMTDIMKNPVQVTRTLEILSMSRTLERIGEHVYHICKELIYLAKGEHENKSLPS